MKINRLTEIILTLLNKKSITAKELSDKFAVSTRTIYRDIETLSASGVPVYMNKGKGGGIFLLDDYSINKTILSESDKQSLMVALKALSSIEYPQINSVIEKIGSIKSERNLENWIEVDLTKWGNKIDKERKFTKIKEAILSKNLITFNYMNSLANKSTRTIEPMRLIYKGQNWYLFGYCRLREDIRIFKISRIRDLVIETNSFEVRKITIEEIDKLNQEISKLVKLKLKINSNALYRVLDDFNQELIIDNKDGTYNVEVEFPENEWLYGYILSFGNNVEVIEPSYIKNIVIQKMKDTISIYEYPNHNL